MVGQKKTNRFDIKCKKSYYFLLLLIYRGKNGKTKYYFGQTNPKNYSNNW